MSNESKPENLKARWFRAHSSEHFRRIVARFRRIVRSPTTLLVGVTLGFVAVLSVDMRPATPEARMPAEYRLQALIDRQGRENSQQREAVRVIDGQVEALRAENQRQTRRGPSDETMQHAESQAQMQAMQGRGFSVTLKDASRSQLETETRDLNNLVIHSQDVQAVTNAMWAAGAEAVAVNNQRIVSTTAVLCVGNTLLINGTVHAPPYEVKAIGADIVRFEADGGVKRLAREVQRYGIGLAIGRYENITIPAYDGAKRVKYAAISS